MDVSVVIPCHGGIADTRACLEALLVQEQAPPLEVLVVDNASPDATATLDREYPVRVLRQSTNLGFAGGVNAGLSAARGDWLLVLNNDTMPAPHMLRRLLDALCDRRIGVAAPVSNFVKGPARIDVGGVGQNAEGRRELEELLTETAGGRIQDVETLAGLCLLFHRGLLDEIGGFDERFGRGNFEDDDFCLRARLAGYRLVIARDAFVHHVGTRTFRAMGLEYQDELADRERIFRRKWLRDPAGAAHLAWRDGRAADAARLARVALGTHPAWPDGLLVLGRQAALCGRHDDAIGHLRDYLTCCPLHTEAVTLLAHETLVAGDLQRAVALLSWAADHCHLEIEEAANILERWGSWQLQDGRGREAAAALVAAFELVPERASVHNLLGVAEMHGGQLPQAVSRLQRALELGSPDAHTNLGICYWESGEPQRALRHFAAAARDNPEDPGARRNLEQVLAACRAAGAVQA